MLTLPIQQRQLRLARWIIVIVLGVALYWGSYLLGSWTLFVVTHPEPPFVNVSREQLDQARAKWLAKGIKEYEIITTGVLANGTERDHWTVSVKDQGIEVGIANITWIGPEGFFTDSGMMYGEASHRTVEGLFETIEDLIATREQLDRVNKVIEAGDYYAVVSFDPDLGYPASIEYRWFKGCSGYSCTWPKGFKVVSIKITE